LRAPARIALALAALSAPMLLGCSRDLPEEWIALVERLTGSAWISIGAGAHEPTRAAKAGDPLVVGNRLETGPRSEAILRLRDGGTLRVKPSSVVRFLPGQAEKVPSLELERGAVVGSASEVEASELVIGVGGRRVHLPRKAVATVTSAAGGAGEGARLQVAFGEASVEGSSGARERVLAGKVLELSLGPTKKAVVPSARPDAGAPATVVSSREMVFFLRATSEGGVSLRRPTDPRAIPVKRGQAIPLVEGARVTLSARGAILVGPEKGAATAIQGPGELVAKQVPSSAPDEPESLVLEGTRGNLRLSGEGSGPAVAPSSGITVDGVKVQTRATWKRVDVRVRRERGRGATVEVVAGEAVLVGKDHKVVVEAGQEATLRAGNVSAPQGPPAGPHLLRPSGAVRVFVRGGGTPFSLKLGALEGARGHLVEVSESPSMVKPLFADVITRPVLTLPRQGRGTLYFRVRPALANGELGKGTHGRVTFLKDTSDRELKDRRPPQNTLLESFGNTTVYYQNLLPRFTFRWNAIPGAETYQLKIFKEQNLRQPVLAVDSKVPSASLAAGKLLEGSYLWYVAGRDAAGTLVRTTKGVSLAIRYDNATPDLQIVQPRDGSTITTATVDASGVALRGSRVFINGAQAALDEGFRFQHTVALSPGENILVFRVEDPKGGSSLYQRRVVRR
jgi:hypothetical protein